MIVGLLLIAVLIAELTLSMMQRSSLHSELVERRENFAAWHPFLQSVPPASDQKLHTNQWGFRGDDIELKKPESTFRVFVLGGSVAAEERDGAAHVGHGLVPRERDELLGVRPSLLGLLNRRDDAMVLEELARQVLTKRPTVLGAPIQLTSCYAVSHRRIPPMPFQ